MRFAAREEAKNTDRGAGRFTRKIFTPLLCSVCVCVWRRDAARNGKGAREREMLRGIAVNTEERREKRTKKKKEETGKSRAIATRDAHTEAKVARGHDSTSRFYKVALVSPHGCLFPFLFFSPLCRHVVEHPPRNVATRGKTGPFPKRTGRGSLGRADVARRLFDRFAENTAVLASRLFSTCALFHPGKMLHRPVAKKKKKK